MEAVLVTGKFVNEAKEPLHGVISFQPSRLFIEEVGVWYATLAPEVELVNGEFAVALTRTDTDALPWHYKAVCPEPIGTWSIRVAEQGPLYLRNLLPSKFRA